MLDPSVGPALGVTFANYEVMESPLMFTAFFLATRPSVLIARSSKRMASGW